MKSIFTSKKLAIIVSYALICTNVLSNLILTPIYLGYLGTDGYGFYQMIYAVASYILILDLGIGTTMVRFISIYKEKKDKKGEEVFAFYSAILVAIVSVFIIIVGFIVNHNLEYIYRTLSANEFQLGHKMFNLMIIVLVLTVWERFLEGLSMSYELFSIAKAVSLFKLLFKFVVVISFLIGNLGVLSLVYADILSICIAIFLYLYLNIKKLHFKIRFHKGYAYVIKPMSTFMLAILLQSIVSYLNNTVDKTILGVMEGKTATGIYSLSMTFITAFNMFPTAISNIFLPQATRLILHNSERKDLTNFVIKPGRFQFIVCGGILTGFILFGQDFITLWAKENEFEIWIISIIIMAPNMITLVENTVLTILDAKNKRMFRSIVMLGISAGNVLLTIMLIKYFGTIGAPIATAISYFIGYILIMNVYYDKVINIDVIYMFKEIFKGIAPCLLMAGGISLSIHMLWKGISLIKIIVEGLIFIFIYGVLLYKWGMKKDEKLSLQQIIRRVG